MSTLPPRDSDYKCDMASTNQVPMYSTAIRDVYLICDWLFKKQSINLKERTVRSLILELIRYGYKPNNFVLLDYCRDGEYVHDFADFFWPHDFDNSPLICKGKHILRRPECSKLFALNEWRTCEAICYANGLPDCDLLNDDYKLSHTDPQLYTLYLPSINLIYSLKGKKIYCLSIHKWFDIFTEHNLLVYPLLYEEFIKHQKYDASISNPEESFDDLDEVTPNSLRKYENCPAKQNVTSLNNKTNNSKNGNPEKNEPDYSNKTSTSAQTTNDKRLSFVKGVMKSMMDSNEIKPTLTGLASKVFKHNNLPVKNCFMSGFNPEITIYN